MRIYRYLKVCLFAAIFKISAWIKAGFIVGSHAVSFSASSMLHPVVGAFCDVKTLAFLYSLLAITKYVLTWQFSAHYLAYHIPGFCAALCWAKPAWRLAIILPVLSFILFVLHPVGGQAWCYTLYWIIPCILSISQLEQPFVKALTATFVAHAVGSVIWIYTVPMTAEQWLGLIPVVAIERFCFALGATGLYYSARAFADSSETAPVSSSQRL